MKRLRENQIVSIGLPGEITYSQNAANCVVLAISGRTASLDALDKSAWVRVPAEVEQVYMTFTHLNALVSLRGRLTSTGELGEMRFAVTDDAHVRTDRPTRANVALPIRVSRRGAEEAFEGITVDISTNGLLVECDLAVEPGESLELALTLPNRRGQTYVAGDVVKADAGTFAVTLPKATTALDTQLALFELITAQRRSEWRAGTRPAVGWSAREL